MLTFKTPWVRTLCILVLLYGIAILYCRTNFYRDPGSRFYDESRAYERSYTAIREIEVQEYITTLRTSEQQQYVKAGPGARVCATFVSVKREGVDYLSPALASAVQGLHEVERSDLYLNALIAHVDPHTHPISLQQWPFDIADSLANYDLPQDQLSHIKELEDSKAFSEKAVIDYTYALRKCLDTNAEWIVLFEDDIILADGWFAHIIQAVAHLTTITDKSKWLFMRLFNQERSTGWSSHDIGGNHELPISLAISIPLLCALVLLRRKSSLVSKHLDNPSILVICLLAVPAWIILFFQAGKASLLPPRPGVYDEPFGCCSQGMLFPRDQIPQVTEYLANRKTGQIDLMLDDYAVEKGLIRYAHYPVLLQHVGTVSARKTLLKEARAIWSMAFEQQDPKKLAAEHASLVKSLYGRE